ncbi:enoyl-CoA hydratase/isomerase family protein [Actinomadura nitritigenes]|uniref:Enoyl-CoA hydratase/isomerase family protein n=1 Tax=Actinomadura nitritigenes TaxID=134602 RepID=A0ABS3R7Q4_9ACTN|nr:enoyl-CoA hydratase-related protein [Actinomadura nitritigenes]MBO2442263.1 enoyl-CoA hydratase/isomerase family protein [Actinomadura nitritigenes]
MIDLRRDGDVHILRFDDGENRFGPDFLSAVEAALDTVEKAEGPRALVTTGTGKFYSNGLDLEWLGAHSDQFESYLSRIHALYARLLELPMPTVAAVNGHAFAGGGMLALAHDFAVMRSDRGYFCLPEVDLGMTFTPGMNALIGARLPGRTAHEAMTTGRRYDAEQAMAAGIVQRTADEAGVLPAALELAGSLAGKDGRVVGKIRADLYRPVLEALRGPALG